MNDNSLSARLGRLTGIISGSLAGLLWMAALWDPSSTFSFNPVSMLVVFLMMLAAILVVIASLKGQSSLLMVLFVVSFLPIGLYVIGVPHWIRWVGLANIGYLAAALLLRGGKQSTG